MNSTKEKSNANSQIEKETKNADKRTDTIYYRLAVTLLGELRKIAYF